MITVLGPTASGKTSFAAHLAHRLGGEIISGDSRQVYRHMDIGTGKDLEDYVVEGCGVPYHLIDIADPGEKYNVYRFQHDFLQAYNDILSRQALPILCGGTGLYIESVLRGYRLDTVPQNPTLRIMLEGKSLDELTWMLRQLKEQSHSLMHNTTDVDTPQRAVRAIEIETYNLTHDPEQRAFPSIPSLVIGLHIDREQRRERISRRLEKRIKEGMIAEIEGILQQGVKPDDLIYYGLEYKFVTLHVTGQLTYEEMLRQLEIAIHQFAKRQMTWFRGMERRGVCIHWIDALAPMDEKLTEALALYSQYQQSDRTVG